MTDRVQVLRDPRAKAYLSEVYTAVAAVDPASAEGIMREVADHLREAATEPGFELDAALAELGDPALIAAGVDAPPATSSPSSARFVDSTAGVIVTVLALSIGTWWTFLLGWVVGICLLWASRRWSRTDKIIGTAAWPAGIVLGLTATSFGGIGVVDVTTVGLVVTPLLAGLWPAIRAFGGIRPRAPRMPVIARAGRGAWLERPIAAGVVWASISVALLTVAVVAVLASAGGPGGPLMSGSADGVRAGLVASDLALLVALVVMWSSRSWEVSDKVLATVLIAVAALVGLLALSAALANGGATNVCTSDGCTAVARVAPAAFAPFAQLVVPALLAAALILLVRFQAAVPGPGAPIVGLRRSAAILIVAVMTAGGAGFVALVLSHVSGSALLLLAAILLLLLWCVAVAALWRSPNWTTVDRALATLVLPALSAIPLLLPRRYGADQPGLGAPASQVNPLLPAAVSGPDGLFIWGVFGVASTLLALWLLVRFVPSPPASVAPRADRAGRVARWVESPRTARIVATVGFGAVGVYAGVAALQILVWNPLAAVPGATLGEISSEIAAARQSFSVASVLGYLALGPLLALVPLVLAWRGMLTGLGAATAVSALISVGAPGYFVASFAPGMALADTYGISGGDHAPGGMVLMLVSASAFVALVGCGVVQLAHSRRDVRGRETMEG